ncbi:regulator of G-protein signaling [Acrasis kona]|uniref:Regulator of G-protein signaling n=1 Tax=Acrasis kona TaxID=1008807 RepID=A0AAW2Z1A3_9EUKA
MSAEECCVTKDATTTIQCNNISLDEINHKVKSEFLASVNTNTGVSLGELSKKHKILFLFLRHTGCPYCKEAVQDICDNYHTLLQFNTIPVLCHLEPEADFAKFLHEDFTDPIIPNLLRVHDKDDYLANTFEVISELNKRKLPGVLMRAAYLYATKGYKIKQLNELFAPTAEGITRTRVPALFILENERIVYQFRHSAFSTRPDYLDLMIDPERKGVASEPTAAEFGALKSDNIYVGKRAAAEPKPRVANSGCMSPNSREKEVANKDECAAISEFLSDSRNRRYFKLYSAKEYSSEHVLFWESVNITYRKNPTAKNAQNIIDSYFDPQSPLGINTTEALKKRVRSRFEEEGPQKDLFDEILSDVESCVLSDTMSRFETSPLYAKLQSKK